VAPEPQVRAWDGLAVAISPDRALLGPEAARMLVAALDFYLRREASVRHSPQARHVRDVLALVGSPTRIGHADVRSEDESASSSAWITTADVAEQLGCSRRHASRLVTAEVFGQALRRKGRWLVRRDEVTAYVAMRNERTA